jgi:hypothetical protein
MHEEEHIGLQVIAGSTGSTGVFIAVDKLALLRRKSMGQVRPVA